MLSDVNACLANNKSNQIFRSKIRYLDILLMFCGNSILKTSSYKLIAYEITLTYFVPGLRR